MYKQLAYRVPKQERTTDAGDVQLDGTSGDQYGRLGINAADVTADDRRPVVKEWSQQEVLLLLEALDAHGTEDWAKVADHVGGRTVAECVGKFLQLPLGDGSEENEEDAALERAAASSSASTSNDLMTDIFEELESLLSTVPKTVVSAASNAAMASFAALKVSRQNMRRNLIVLFGSSHSN